ncbi:hypothetical protein [Paraglaciecola sp. L1A13]|uniref:hypothetical protein n=1 Tax=Paraglaciecola sp. L1A13 TaxID=2686359 RepID=UPI00131AE03A|nr:hypothetical protein [Paraglaciecola sp. L1A13]
MSHFKEIISHSMRRMLQSIVKYVSTYIYEAHKTVSNYVATPKLTLNQGHIEY